MALDPITIARLWLLVKPIKRLKERRQRRMAEKFELTLPDGTKIERTEPLIPWRTSTKVKAASWITILGSLAVYLPFYEQANALFMQACSSGDAPLLVLAGMVYMAIQDWIVARKTKSPLQPGKVL